MRKNGFLGSPDPRGDFLEGEGPGICISKKLILIAVVQLQTGDIYKLTLILRGGQYFASQGCSFGPSGVAQLLPMLQATYTSDTVRHHLAEACAVFAFLCRRLGKCAQAGSREDGSGSHRSSFLLVVLSS